MKFILTLSPLGQRHKNEISDIVNKNNANNQLKITPNINSSCINALRFDTNSNNSFDELINMSSLNEFPHKTSFSSANIAERGKAGTPVRNKTPIKSQRLNKSNGDNISSGKTQMNLDNSTDLEIGSLADSTANSASPPPPPSIGSVPVLNTQISAPSPTKLSQYYPYTASGGHVMHRLILNFKSYLFICFQKPILNRVEISNSGNLFDNNFFIF